MKKLLQAEDALLHCSPDSAYRTSGLPQCHSLLSAHSFRRAVFFSRSMIHSYGCNFFSEPSQVYFKEPNLGQRRKIRAKCFKCSWTMMFSGEKMGLTMNVLLSIVVFLLLVSKILPPTSSSIPLVAKYLLLTFVLNIITILITVSGHTRRSSLVFRWLLLTSISAARSRIVCRLGFGKYSCR